MNRRKCECGSTRLEVVQKFIQSAPNIWIACQTCGRTTGYCYSWEQAEIKWADGKVNLPTEAPNDAD